MVALVSTNQLEDSLDSKTSKKYAQRKRKLALKKTMRKLTPRRKKAANKRSKKIMINSSSDSIRTRYEEIYESYLRLLGQPYLINQIYCFDCGNFYQYQDILKSPKKCQVCQTIFHKPGSKDGRISYLARPDFILDFNNPEARLQYKHDCNHHRLNNIKLYQSQYMQKVAVIRIDGSIHNKQSQRIKDWHQYKNFCERGIKVFIVTNDDVDKLLQENNGDGLLKLAHQIGNCVIDEELYTDYITNNLDFRERVTKPF